MDSNFKPMENPFFMTSENGKELEIIKKDNRLIEARYRLSIHEQRLMWSVLGSIQVDDEDFKKYTINIQEIAEFHGLQANKDLYTQIQQAARTLKNSEVDISRDGLKRYVNWLNYVEYASGSGKVTICFNAELKPYLLHLKKNFTQYELAAVVNFKNSYSIRFYEFLKMRQNQGGGGHFFVRYSIEDLKDMLGILPDEYEKTNDFKRFVIEPSLKEIDTLTDLKIIEVQYLKTGRAISDIKIYAEPKKQKALAIPKQPDESPTQPKEKPIPRAVQALNEMGFSTAEATKLVKEHKSERIIRDIGYTLAVVEERKGTSNEIKSKSAYLRTVLKGDGGEAWAKEQAEKVEKKQMQLLEEQKKRQKEKETDKKIEQEREEARRMYKIYDGLSSEEQAEILNELLEILQEKHAPDSLVLGNFYRDKKSNTAHKSPLISIDFRAVMKSHGL
jgi:plasmid replication initiation protein